MEKELLQIEADSYRYAVKNAFLHNGKADVGAVVGKIIALHKNTDIKKAMPLIQNAVKKVNCLNFEDIEIEFKKFEERGYELKPAEKKEGLIDLDWAEAGEKVVTRYAPNPNGPFHLGNARAAILSHEFARKYKGKFILRFDDTDPKVKKPIADAEKIFLEDLNWLECKPDEIYFASDRLELYYSFMRKLLEIDGAYVCTCEKESWKKGILSGEGCDCRKKSKEDQLKNFEKMLFHKFKEGDAVLRIKTDLNHPDPSVRDWWLAKIVDSPQHPRVGSKFHLWPSYNFASAIDDHELGTTLILRGQEHAQNQTKQEFLYKYFEWTYPHSFHFGRVKLEKMVLSTSKIKLGIESGKYNGWDDIRLGTIRALRRKGFVAQALKKAIIDVGVKSSDTTIELKKLAALNKEFLGELKRIVFIEEPIELDVNFCPKTSVNFDGKIFELKEGNQRFTVSKKQLAQSKIGETFRLRNAYNAKLKSAIDFRAEADFLNAINLKKEHDSINIVSWILHAVDVEILMPDSKKIYGLAEEDLLDLKAGEHVQFDKFGICIIDSKKDGRINLWFSHE